MRSHLMLLALGLVSCSDLESPAKPHMMGGALVTDPELPEARSMVGLRRNVSPNRTDFCSATLIAPRIVLTAAHCVEAYPPPESVAFGLDLFGEAAMLRRIAKMLRHPRFVSFSYANDIALVNFEGDAPPGSAPADLVGSRHDTIEKGLGLIAVGYGKSHERPASGLLRQLLLTARGLDLTGHTFRAQGQPGTGVCFGDSGGPAFLRFSRALYQAGIVSTGETQCVDEITTYTNVLDYRSWILGELRALGEERNPFSKWDEISGPTPKPEARDAFGNPTTFEGWCQDFAEQNEERRRTIGKLLELAGTWRCREAAEHAASWKTLDLSYAYLSDVTPLAALTRLEELSLRGNSLTSVSALNALRALRKLDLRDNRFLTRQCPLENSESCLF